MMIGAEAEIREPSRLIMPQDDWSSSHALSVVMGDFHRAESYRTNNHDWRWEKADRRYLGDVPQKFWEGTNSKRANLSVMTAYEQIEALVPLVVQAVFGEDPWFETVAIGRTPPQAAVICREVIAAQLYQTRVRKVVKLALRSSYGYGNGPLELC